MVFCFYRATSPCWTQHFAPLFHPGWSNNVTTEKLLVAHFSMPCSWVEPVFHDFRYSQSSFDSSHRLYPLARTPAVSKPQCPTFPCAFLILLQFSHCGLTTSMQAWRPNTNQKGKLSWLWWSLSSKSLWPPEHVHSTWLAVGSGRGTPPADSQQLGNILLFLLFHLIVSKWSAQFFLKSKQI